MKEADKYASRPLRAFQLRVLAAIESVEPKSTSTAQVTELVFGSEWSEVNRRQTQRAITALFERGLIRKAGQPDWRGKQRWRSRGLDT